MRDHKIDQLAATLKSAGLCASLYDAKNMAESITYGVEAKQEDMERRFEQAGSVNPHPLFRPVGQVLEPPEQVVTQCVEKEVFVNTCEKPPVEKQSAVTSLNPDTFNPAAAPSIFEESNEIILEEAPAQESVQVMQEPSQVVQAPVLPIHESSEQAETWGESWRPAETVQETTSVVEEPRVVESVEQVPEPVQIEPIKEPVTPKTHQQTLIRGKTMYEIEQDKTKPRATLTEEQKKSVDITRIFNFANR